MNKRDGYASGHYGNLLRMVRVLNNPQTGLLASVGVQLMMMRSEKR